MCFSCDHNQYSIEYILALSRAKRKCHTASSEDSGVLDSEGVVDSESVVDTDSVVDSESDNEQSDTVQTEERSELMSDLESNSSYSVDAT